MSKPPTLPTVSLLQGRPYTRAIETDIRKTFALFGWKPKEQTCATSSRPS